MTLMIFQIILIATGVIFLILQLVKTKDLNKFLAETQAELQELQDQAEVNIYTHNSINIYKND